MRFTVFTFASALLCAVSALAAPNPAAQKGKIETFCMYCPNNCTYECPINARCVCPGVLEGSDPNSCPSALTSKIVKKCYKCKACPFGPRILCADNGEECLCPEMAIPELDECKKYGL